MINEEFKKALETDPKIKELDYAANTNVMIAAIIWHALMPGSGYHYISDKSTISYTRYINIK